mgnify:CR=1 FL=1|jgi:hypothetical protein
MTVRSEMAKWRATRVTCEPCSCQSRFSRQSRPSRFSQASALAAKAFVNGAGEGENLAERGRGGHVQLASGTKGKPEWKAIEKEDCSRIHVLGLGRDRPVLCPPLANPLGPMVRQNKSRGRRSTSSVRTRYC